MILATDVIMFTCQMCARLVSILPGLWLGFELLSPTSKPGNSFYRHNATFTAVQCTSVLSKDAHIHALLFLHNFLLRFLYYTVVY